MNASRRLFGTLNYMIAACLALMSVLVFLNVILRYFFHSGLTWAEEVSRFAFIWLIFLGAITAYKDNEHLGIDTLVRKLGPHGRRILFVINAVIVLVTMLMVTWGAWQLTELNMDQSSPAINLPYAYVYASGVVMGIGISLITLSNLYRLIRGDISDEELVMSTDSEDDAKVAKLTEDHQNNDNNNGSSNGMPAKGARP